MSFLAKKAPEDENLPDTGDKDKNSLSHGPILNSLIDILCKRPALRFTEPMVGLVVGDDLEV